MAYTDEQIQDIQDSLVLAKTDLLRISSQFADLKSETMPVQDAVNEMRVLSDNINTKVTAVEDRLTARETSHMALINQLNDILGQMQVKLQGALELKPEIMPYDNALAAGYLDTETGIKLRADATAQRKFTSQLLILRTAVEYAGAPTNMPVRLWDYNGNTHEIPFTTYVGLMLRFGMFVAQVEASF